MSKFLQSVVFVCLVLLFFSCKKESFLAPITTTNLKAEEVFADSAYTMDALLGVYQGVDFSFDVRRFGGYVGLSAACDEAEGPSNVSDNGFLQFATGAINPNNIRDDAWARSWGYIRAANQILKNISKARFSKQQRERVRGEALFLRAWYYSIMVKHYGGVPIIGDTLYSKDDVISAKRRSYEDCVNYIVSQCDSAKKYLTGKTFDQYDYGRATEWACEALKSRVLLYAASPLFNDDGTIPGRTPMSLASDPEVKKLVAYPQYNRERWRLAKESAKKVMDLSGNKLLEGTSSPAIGFYMTFLKKNNEMIFFRVAVDGAINEKLFAPPGFGGRSQLQGAYPYQELVDAFDMINGKPITDITSGYDPANPYANRDPRLARTIAYNGTLKMKYTGTTQLGLSPVLTFVGSNTVDEIYKGTKTGYYINKMLGDSIDARNFLSYKDNRVIPLIRYAEILLNYAEAVNEYDGPTEAYAPLIALRKRAGILPGADDKYGLRVGMSKEEMRAVIQHERRIELAFEEHRFWDIRRWKIAMQTENRSFSGMEALRIGANKYNYQRVNISRHTFQEKNYLWPFPQHEVSKNSADPNLKLVQNPGY